MANTTITTTAAEDARISAAFGAKLGLTNAQGDARNASAAEIKADIVLYVKTVVADQERIAASKAVPAPINPT